ncbi:MAG TPA: YggS family pyridoxal phosphate-dependent enzyme [Candidatus Agrococcus pullicola]|uniref:Pyridoxal phosphate homeostasis protein n=1 Tax=Candidatus Agrococcus pullicola TaxID=2838429 RepID=A0A9D2C9P6_9MICO|nr:YggS family pyridoxal phosphate-dependent enzyme [Candidatus Agrococcus pullicola]
MSAAERLEQFRAELREASVGLAAAPTLIVITKFHPDELVRELFDAGQRHFGENRHPEARNKRSGLDEDEAVWHFVGQLQRNKVRQVARYADVLHAVDRKEIIELLETGEDIPTRDVFLQVNLTDDPGRGGVDDAGFEALAERAAESSAVRVHGVMAVAPLDETPERAHERIAAYSQRLLRILPNATSISSGMSSDWRSALRYGATHLRIGTAITGSRPDSA